MLWLTEPNVRYSSHYAVRTAGNASRGGLLGLLDAPSSFTAETFVLAFALTSSISLAVLGCPQRQFWLDLCCWLTGALIPAGGYERPPPCRLQVDGMSA
jgi:hypothetical protein